MIKFGGPVWADTDDPDAWAEAVKALGYRATFCPAALGADDETVKAYEAAAAKHDIVIAEVGAWSNPLSEDEATRAEAMDKCIAALDLAERIGACCAVNIAGSRGVKWDGPCAADLTDQTFEMIVRTVRTIIDTVQPRRTFYTIEPMPWMYPDSPDSYLKLIEAVDRPAFGAHLDPVNMINCPARYFRNDAFLRECIAKLGPHIKSCHIKDISLGDQLTVHLSEVRPGLGALRTDVYLTGLAALGRDVPLLLEHLPSPAEYDLAAMHVREVALAAGVAL